MPLIRPFEYLGVTVYDPLVDETARFDVPPQYYGKALQDALVLCVEAVACDLCKTPIGDAEFGVLINEKVFCRECLWDNYDDIL